MLYTSPALMMTFKSMINLGTDVYANLVSTRRFKHLLSPADKVTQELCLQHYQENLKGWMALCRPPYISRERFKSEEGSDDAIKCK